MANRWIRGVTETHYERVDGWTLRLVAANMWTLFEPQPVDGRSVTPVPAVTLLVPNGPDCHALAQLGAEATILRLLAGRLLRRNAG